VSDLSAIRTGLAANLETAFPTLQVGAWALASPTPPCMYIVPDEPLVDFHQSMGMGAAAAVWYRLLAVVLVGEFTDIGAQQQLDEFIGASGAAVKAALESDRKLAGACDDLIVDRVSGYRRYDHAVSYLGAEWQLRVLA
jgi:hypothetical protein